jgi:hypothetical protein
MVWNIGTYDIIEGNDWKGDQGNARHLEASIEEILGGEKWQHLRDDRVGRESALQDAIDLMAARASWLALRRTFVFPRPFPNTR